MISRGTLELGAYKSGSQLNKKKEVNTIDHYDKRRLYESMLNKVGKYTSPHRIETHKHRLNNNTNRNRLSPRKREEL